MKKIIVSGDGGTYRLARFQAARMGTSVSALVRGLVNSLVHGDAYASKTASRPERAVAKRRETSLSETFADFGARAWGCAWPITSPVKPCTSAMRLVDTKIPIYAIGASPEDADTCCRSIPAKGS